MVPMHHQARLCDIYAENKDFFDSLAKEDLQKWINHGNKFQYGNNKKFKTPSERWKDKWLKSLKREWFEGKWVLDIGCHTGDLTLMLTLLYKPDLIIGVDIDHKLVSGAIK